MRKRLQEMGILLLLTALFGWWWFSGALRNAGL